MAKYDVLLVGAGLFNAVLAASFVEKGKKVLVIDRRTEVGGNCATESVLGITVHKYGAHIFHTSDREAWEFANRFAEFMPFVNSPVAKYINMTDTEWSCKGVYNLPFNMITFAKLWPTECADPASAEMHIGKLTEKFRKLKYDNLEEKALSMVGEEMYELFIKHYTEKQWGCPCTELSPDIITRIPLRFTFDNNYFNDTWQGIPREGYSKWISNMLTGADLVLGEDYLSDRKRWDGEADHVFYSGMLDELFDYSDGCLPYRSLRFQTSQYATSNCQGVAVVNYTGPSPEYTRSIEHKHFAHWDKGLQERKLTEIGRAHV